MDSEEENASSAEWSGSRDLLSTASPIVSVPATIKPTQEASNPVRPSHELFTRPGHYWSMHRVDVASDTEGIELLGYQRFGTIHGLHWGVRHRSGSVPTVSLSALDLQTSSVPNVPLLPIRNENAVSFEGFFGTTQKSSDQRELESDSNSLEMLHISDKESSILRPLLWLELSAIFDKHSIPCRKRMPYKRKRKENGNVFGVSLSTLVMRDRRIHIDNSTVPQIFQMILNELEVRWCKEEGILRIAGHKQRVETLCAQIEANFYTKPDEIRACLEKSTCHELTSILKRLLRELPQPLLTSELIELFYQCQQLVGESQARALNLLVLLLPIEHSGTLRILISFLDAVIRNDKLNKMSLHNVAMIMAPSMFPPRAVQVPCRSVHQTDISIQVKMAAVCCHLVEMLLTSGFDLWKIPSTLWLQHQTRNFHPEKPSRPKEPLHRSNTNFVSVGSNKPKDRFI